MANDRRKLKTRQQILDAALELFAGRGFEGASVRDIAKRADVGNGTVFWHFGDKVQLYAQVVQLAGDRFLCLMHGHSDSDRATLAETLAEWVCALEQGDATALLCTESRRHRNPAIAESIESLNERLVDFWQRRLDTDRYAPEAPPMRRRELAYLIVATAPAFVAARSGEAPTVVTSALMRDFAAAVECMAAGSNGGAG